MFALQMLSEGGEGPNTELQLLLVIGIAFFFLVIIVGWLSSARKQAQVQTEPAHEPVHHEEKHADDLAKIEGIGPKVVKVLSAAGITTFDDLAHAKSADVQKVLNEAGLQMMNPEGWIDQAKAAAKGDWKTVEKLQKELKGGRKK
jgi:hypothetical protein